MTDSTRIDPAVDQFADVVQRYCIWATGNLGEPQEEMRRARLLLSELHLAAISLPDLGCGEDYDTERSSSEWKQVYQKFAALPVKGYLDVFNPLEDKEPVFNQLNGDLGDIYRDIKAGLTLYDEGHIVEAVWEWRFNFQIHWGHHLVGAQRAIHQFLSDEGL
jgi:hypothetical protein